MKAMRTESFAHASSSRNYPRKSSASPRVASPRPTPPADLLINDVPVPSDFRPVHASNSCPDPYRRDGARTFDKPRFPMPRTQSYGSPRSGHSKVDGFAGEICPGDVLNIIGKETTITRLGAAGGLMGHVLLAVSSPVPINKHSEVGRAFRKFRCKGRNELYSVAIVECSRDTEGLYQASLVLCVDETGRVLLCGEHGRGEMSYYDNLDEVHIWHSPSEFRGENFRRDVMCDVLEAMRSNQQNWSWSTAVRAFFMSGTVAPMTLKEVHESWQAEPICTSIVVIFWQRYFDRLADLNNIDSLDMILEHMPLRADRVLPGELLTTMLSRGWSLSQGPGSIVEGRGRTTTM